MAALDTQIAYFWNLMHKNNNSRLTIAICSSIINAEVLITPIVDHALNYFLFEMMILNGLHYHCSPPHPSGRARINLLEIERILVTYFKIIHGVVLFCTKT